MSSDVAVVCTVVVPTYNRAHYLGRCLTSLLSAGVPGLEIVVVDDGSTDDTADVVRQFEGTIRYVHQRNAGPAKARNTGIRAARGTYLAFLDSDDEYLPGVHARMIGFLESNAHVAGCFADVLLNDSEGAYARGLTRPHFADFRALPAVVGGAGFRVLAGSAFASYLLTERNVIATPAPVLRRSAVLEHSLFDETLTGYEEWDFYTRFALVHTVAYLDEPCARMDKHGANLSANLELMVGNDVRIRGKFVEHAASAFPALVPLLECRQRASWLDWANHALQRNDRSAARARLWAYVRRFGPTPRALTLWVTTWLPADAIDRLRGVKRLLFSRRAPRPPRAAGRRAPKSSRTSR